MTKKKVCVLTGAGVSAESGINTFRDAGGLWEGHDVMEVASPHGWHKNPALVLDFYNKRRRQLKDVQPNRAHREIAGLEERHDVVVITQNVDDLHERGGSNRIIHLHGELTKVRSIDYPDDIYEWKKDLNLGDLCRRGGQLRPHIVWFGEDVPMLIPAIEEIKAADAVLIVGTSMQVYPAAGLIGYAPDAAIVCYVDPRPQVNYELSQAHHLEVFRGPATLEVPKAVNYIERLWT